MKYTLIHIILLDIYKYYFHCYVFYIIQVPIIDIVRKWTQAIDAARNACKYRHVNHTFIDKLTKWYL